MTEIKDVPVKPEETTSKDTGAWDASQYEAALAHLEKLDNQIREVGNSIPDLLAPLADIPATRTQMFNQIKKAAIGVTGNLQTLRNDYLSQQSQDVFTKASQSRQDDPDLTRANEIKEHGWASDSSK